MDHKIYIILPVHNRKEITRCFIECLLSQTYQNYHLILVDDGSIDGTEEMVRSQVRSLTVIKGQGNWWWAGSLQQGVNWLKNNNVNGSDLVLMINDDVTFTSDFLTKAVEVLSRQQKSLIIAQAEGIKTGRLVNTGVKANLKLLSFQQAPSPEEINCLPTRGLFMRISDLKEIGNFYPKILPHYLSDYEFTIRAFKKGFKLTTSPNLQMYFNEETTGYINFEKLDFKAFLSKYFSNKSKANPLHWSSFVILACPKFWVTINLVIIWKRSVLTILKYASSKLFVSKNKITY